MVFSQYEGYLYMYILFLTMIPAIGLGLMGKKIKYYAMTITCLMIYLIVGINVQFGVLLAFMIWEVATILIYMKIRQNSKNKWTYRLFLFSAMLPLSLIHI